MKVQLSVFFLMLLASQWVPAETISGRVTDDGDAMPKAYVTLYEGKGDVIIEMTYSDTDGGYRLTVPPGSYRLCVSAEEYAPECVKGVVVGGADVSLDVPMTPSAFVETTGEKAADDCQ